MAAAASAQVRILPEGTTPHWIIEQPEEVVAHVLFDPTTVKHPLPPTLRSITIGELAAQGMPWATEHVAAEPAHDEWGISFFGIVRMEMFNIDGRSPDWPEPEAAALQH